MIIIKNCNDCLKSEFKSVGAYYEYLSLYQETMAVCFVSLCFMFIFVYKTRKTKLLS